MEQRGADAIYDGDLSSLGLDINENGELNVNIEGLSETVKEESEELQVNVVEVEGEGGLGIYNLAAILFLTLWPSKRRVRRHELTCPATPGVDVTCCMCVMRSVLSLSFLKFVCIAPV